MLLSSFQRSTVTSRCLCCADVLDIHLLLHQWRRLAMHCDDVKSIMVAVAESIERAPPGQLPEEQQQCVRMSCRVPLVLSFFRQFWQAVLQKLESDLGALHVTANSKYYQMLQRQQLCGHKVDTR